MTETHVSCFDWLGDESDVILYGEGPTENNFGQISEVETRVNHQLLVGEEGLVEGGEVFGWGELQSPLVATEQKAGAGLRARFSH